MICCADSLYLGCFDSCEDVDTGLLATETGVHRIEVYFNSLRFIFLETVTTGNPIIITGDLNENYTFDMKIINPSGSTFSSGGKECFTFKTIISV